MPEPVKIFLSYAHADGDGVGRIYQHLKERGHKPWLDREDILGGEEWELAIRTGIRESDLFLLCLSPHSLVRRGVLQKEIKIALDVAEEKLDTDIFLIPVWIQVGTPLPKEEMPERLSRLQWINLPEADGWQKLLRSIDHQSRRLGRDLGSPPLATTDTLTADRGASSVDVDQLVGRLRMALQASDPAEVEATVASILDELRRRGHGFTAQHGTRVVTQLWRKHLVGHVHQLTDAFILSGIDVPPIRRFYAEALLERQWLTATFDALAKLEQTALSDPTERALVGDLRGRSHTVAYLDAARATPDAAADQLWRAVSAYHDIYNSDPRRHLLHGSRAAALVVHAARNGLSAETVVSPSAIAARVLEEVHDSDDTGRPLGIDDCEAALYASLALDRQEEALERLQRCLDHAQTDILNLRTIERQLTGIWQLRPDMVPGTALLRPIAEELKVRCEPFKPVDTTSVQARETASQSGSEARLEKVFGQPHFYSMEWYRQGLLCAQHVARIETLQGTPIATGFLLSGRELHPSLPDEPLLLTNSYVVTNDQAVKDHYAFSVLGPDEVQVRFQTDERLYSVSVVWSSFAAGTTILRLTPRMDHDRYLKIAKHFPIINGDTRAFIVGHPGGRDLTFSMQDNVLLDCDDRVVHYRTPTEAGSSGSPVFNGVWEVIAIHHARGHAMPRLNGRPGTYEANEGIRIDFLSKTIDSQAVGAT